MMSLGVDTETQHVIGGVFCFNSTFLMLKPVEGYIPEKAVVKFPF